MAELQVLNSNFSSGQGCVWNVWQVHLWNETSGRYFTFCHRVVTAVIKVKAGHTHMMCGRTVEVCMRGWYAMTFNIHLSSLPFAFIPWMHSWRPGVMVMNIHVSTFTVLCQLRCLMCLKLCQNQCCTAELVLLQYKRLYRIWTTQLSVVSTVAS